MAKGKNLNPADAQRKAERKKELKKNKAERQKSRDLALVKKDTTDIEEEIQRLEKAENDQTITASERSKLPQLRAELKRIDKKKEEYVAEHPEHRRLVYRARYTKAEETQNEELKGKNKERKVFDKNGIPRHPERSIYYDPVMNPFGVPPPGMPYQERPLRPDEVDSQAEDDSDKDSSNDDIAMPSGPPPPSKDALSKDDSDDADERESDDDIPMPEGPPPSHVLPPLPPVPPPPNMFSQYYPNVPMTSATNYTLPAPPGFAGAIPMGVAPHAPHMFLTGQPAGFPAIPPPPPFPIGREGVPSRPPIQSQLAHPLPAKPAGVPGSSTTSPTQGTVPVTTGTISAPAQLRDFKKESTAFVPPSLKRKKPGGDTSLPGGRSASMHVNPAPTADDAGDKDTVGEVDSAPSRPDLLGTLQSNFPGRNKQDVPGESSTKRIKPSIPEGKMGKDDYAKFMEEIGDIL